MSDYITRLNHLQSSICLAEHAVEAVVQQRYDLAVEYARIERAGGRAWRHILFGLQRVDNPTVMPADIDLLDLEWTMDEQSIARQEQRAALMAQERSYRDHAAALYGLDFVDVTSGMPASNWPDGEP